MLPSLTALMVSCQLVFSAFFISILGVRHSAKAESAEVVDAEVEIGRGLPETNLISELPEQAIRR
jgi:hypothetical protein